MLVTTVPAELAPHLWMLGTREYPLYLDFQRLEGSLGAETDCTLFEGGIGPSAEIVAGQIGSRGIAPDELRQIVVTHAHPDHVMAVAGLRRYFPQARVLASAVAARTMASEKAMALFGSLDAALCGALASAGLVAAPEQPAAAPAGPLTVDRTLAEGDRVEVGGGRAYEVLETPGHSECSLSFFEPTERVLLISDATGYYLPQDQWWWPNYFSDYGRYVASIERLAGLGAEVLGLSHNAAIRGAEDVAGYFAAALAATRQYHDRIVTEIRAGRAPRDLAAQLGAEVHAKTPLLPLDFFQKNCGLLVKLSMKHEWIEG